MLVYLKLLFQDENIVVYEYGLTEETMIGKVKHFDSIIPEKVLIVNPESAFSLEQ